MPASRAPSNTLNNQTKSPSTVSEVPAQVLKLGFSSTSILELKNHNSLNLGATKLDNAFLCVGITEYRLANGLRVLMFPDQTKQTITVNITYLVGSATENYGETGMAHLLEHLVFKGSPKHPNIPQELTAHGSRPSGTTWTDRTNYFETFAATDENLNWALILIPDPTP